MERRVAALLAMTTSIVAIATKLIVMRRLAGKPTWRHPRSSIGDIRAIARSAEHDVAMHLERPTDLREAGGWSAASLRSSQ